MEQADYDILRQLVINSSPKDECGIVSAKTGFRVLDVLDYFESHCEPVGTRELGRVLGIPSSSMDEILKAMTSRGYLAYDLKTKKYAPSYKIVEMGRTIADSYFAHDPILQIMQKVTSETGFTSALTMLEGFRMHSLAYVEGEWGLPGLRGKGARRHLFLPEQTGWRTANAFASALLADLPNTLIVDLAIQSAYKQNVPANSLQVKEVISEVNKVRINGYAWNCSKWVPYIHMIAVPIGREFASSPMAVGLVGHNIFESIPPYVAAKMLLNALEA